MFANPSLRMAASALTQNRWPLGPLLAVALVLGGSPGLAQAPLQKSFFAPPCAHLPALLRTTANGPEDESQFDTARIQQALDSCPAGQAVELEPALADQQTRNAFLTAPLRIPAGVALLIDAGVTVFASRRPEDYRQPQAVSASDDKPCGNLACLPLLRAQGAAGSPPAAVEGFGTLDGRASANLLGAGPGSSTWASLPLSERPALIAASGSFALRKLTLRDAAATALQSTGSGEVDLDGVKILGSVVPSGAPSIEVPSRQLQIANTSFSPTAGSIRIADPANLRVDLADPDRSPAPEFVYPADPAAPLYSGEVFLSDSHSNNLSASDPRPALSLNAVVSATQPGLPSPAASITFFDGAEPLGTADLTNGVATLPLPPLLSARVHILTAHASSGLIAFGSAHADVQTTITTLALSSSVTHATYATPVTLTASSTPGAATGQVSFLDGSSVLGQSTLINGSASFTETQLAPGTHSLTAQYAGDSNNSAAASPALSLRVDSAQTVLTLSGVPANSVYGSAISLSTSVAPASASGSVTFMDRFTANGQTSSTALGSFALSSGRASLPLTTLAIGSHLISASYAGDTNDTAATSSPAALTVSPMPTSTTLAASNSTVPYGAPITLAATLTPAAATGTITFQDSSSGTLGQSAVANGGATLTLTSLPPGPHSISAAYSGDQTHSASVSPATPLNIARVATEVMLAPLPAAISAGSSLLLSASIEPATATGLITFFAGNGVALAQAPILSGRAAVALNSLAPGAYTIFASYSGDSNAPPATSAPQTVQIGASAPSITLAASLASVPFGSSVTLIASVQPASAAGVITFSDSVLGPIGSVAASNGIATVQLSSLSVGNHTLLASFGASSQQSSARSSPLNVTVTPDATTTRLTLAATTIPAGSPIIFNVAISTGATVIPTGAVQILSGTRLLLSSPIQNAAPGSAFLTLFLPASNLGTGSFPITAVYTGDQHNASSSSPAGAAVTVVPTPTTAALTLPVSRIPLHLAVALRVAVTSPGPAPTGTVSFLDDGTVFASAPLSSIGTASVAYTPTRLGSHALSALFQPAGSFAPSSADFQPLEVTLPLALALAPSTLSASANSTHTADLDLTPLSGFSGPITSECSSPASFITCTVSAAPNVNAAAHATVTIHVAHDLSGHASLEEPLSPPSGVALASLLPLLLVGRKHPRIRLRLFSTLAAALLVSASLSGCALGGNFFALPTGPQTVTVTVSAAGSTVSSTLTINITSSTASN